MKRSTTTLGHRGRTGSAGEARRRSPVAGGTRCRPGNGRAGSAQRGSGRPVWSRALLASNLTGAQGGFRLLEATIDDAHAAFASGELTCRALVQGYLDRIAAYDQTGPSLNAVQTINRDALAQADALDAAYAEGRPHGAAPLRAGAAQGPGGDAGDADHLRVGALRRLRLRPRRDDRRAAGGSGRDHPRQDEHGRVCLTLRRLRLRHHPQRLRPGPQPERLVRGHRGRRRGQLRAGRDRRGHRRIHPRAGRRPRPGRAPAHGSRWSAASG